MATLKKEIETKDEIIQNLNKGYNFKFQFMNYELKLEIVELENCKQKRMKEEKEAIKKERKHLKKTIQKVNKEKEKQKTQFPENNNMPGYQVDLKELRTYPCNLCDHKAKTQD